jgi:hypothetical protein
MVFSSLANEAGPDHKKSRPKSQRGGVFIFRGTTLFTAFLQRRPQRVRGCPPYPDPVTEEKESALVLDPAAHVAQLEAGGMERREAMRQVARLRGISRRDVYQAVLGKKQKKK